MATSAAPIGDPAGPTTDPTGRYPTGTAGLVRDWDGHAWAGTLEPDPDAPAIANHGHGPLRTKRFWFAAIAVVVGCGLAAVAGAAGPSLRWLAGVAGAVAVAGTLLGLSAAVWHRLRLRQAIEATGWSVRALIGLGLVCGLVALGVALGVELFFSKVLGVEQLVVLFLAGPIEETAKLLLPVILFVALKPRLADPRVGFALVWVSATLFGFAEGIEYLLGLGGGERHEVPRTGEDTRAASDAVLLVSRSVTELIHPLLTAGAAAVMWLGAWRGRALLAGGGLIAYLTAIALHSINDGVIGGLLQTAYPPLVLIVWPLWVVLIYQVFRVHTKELVPPGALEISPRRWRPSTRH